MNQWFFVIAAYGVAVLGTGAILIESFLAMRRAENAADKVRRR
ncbi:hypothetical protein OKW76_00065 [Sphingomonas sp. S1-29]|nr:hypothetical protein [Sphingomonas sp. S1-29]UZK69522.1 hypothetical protein OKW76_00065 [Sphingomonas sp. S1-29]